MQLAGWHLDLREKKVQNVMSASNLCAKVGRNFVMRWEWRL